MTMVLKESLLGFGEIELLIEGESKVCQDWSLSI